LLFGLQSTASGLIQLFFYNRDDKMICKLLKHTFMGLVILITTIPVNSGIQEQPLPNFDDRIPEVWRPAPTPPGALDWQTLINVRVHHENVDNFMLSVPSFTQALEALDGQRVKLNGYMMPLSASEAQSHFILMAYPHSCPFHMLGGLGGFVEIEADFPVNFTYEPVLIEGQFQLLEDYSNGLFYRINAAQAVTQ
ncbi:MAG: DUF3299 domain-containing protein, partial [Kordiimonas sp.]